VDFLCELVLHSQDRAAATFHTMSAGNLQRLLQKDWVMVGSDSAVRSVDGPLSDGKPHPRAFGAMPRMLGWAVRDKGWLSLAAAVKKMTFDPCQRFGLRDRGLIREGMKADLCLFDPEQVRDTATHDDPKQYPRGIEMVLVNGEVTVAEGRPTGARAGQVLRPAWS
jgi:N-acyl-D-aspartate/D-glutamate deacylase